MHVGQAGQCDRGDPRLGAPGHGDVRLAGLQQADRIDERLHAGGAGGRGGDGGSLDAIGDRDLTARHIRGEHGNHQRPDARWAVHGHGGDIAFDRRDATAAGVHDHGDTVAVLVGDLQLCVREGLPGAGDREMREAVHAANRFGIHERFGVEVGNLGGDLDRKILGVEMLDATDAGASGDQSFP